MPKVRKPIMKDDWWLAARQRRDFAAVPPADYEVITDYVADCPSCNASLPTTQHNNQFAYDETVKCDKCGKTTRVIWSNWL